MNENRNLGILDLIEILNLGLQVYDINLNKNDLIETLGKLKKIESQNEEILKILKEK